MSTENQIEDNLIKHLVGLKYSYRPDIVDRKTLEQNFKTKFEALNRVHLSDNEFLRLREEQAYTLIGLVCRQRSRCARV